MGILRAVISDYVGLISKEGSEEAQAEGTGHVQSSEQLEEGRGRSRMGWRLRGAWPQQGWRSRGRE